MTQNYPTDLLQGWNILIVDDEEDSLAVAEFMLSFYGANVTCAGNGQEALTYARQLQPRFILSDLSMPIMDGWELLHHLRQDSTLSQTPVIALTAHAMRGDRERALASGFYSYITKPLSADTFIEQVVTLLVGIPEFKAELSL